MPTVLKMRDQIGGQNITVTGDPKPYSPSGSRSSKNRATAVRMFCGASWDVGSIPRTIHSFMRRPSTALMSFSTRALWGGFAGYQWLRSCRFGHRINAMPLDCPTAPHSRVVRLLVPLRQRSAMREQGLSLVYYSLCTSSSVHSLVGTRFQSFPILLGVTAPWTTTYSSFPRRSIAPTLRSHARTRYAWYEGISSFCSSVMGSTSAIVKTVFAFVSDRMRLQKWVIAACGARCSYVRCSFFDQPILINVSRLRSKYGYCLLVPSGCSPESRVSASGGRCLNS